MNFNFHFTTTLIAEIAQSHSHCLPTSLVLNHLYFLSTSFLAYGCSALQELFNEALCTPNMTKPVIFQLLVLNDKN